MLLLLPVKAVSSAAKQAQEELEANFKRHQLKPLLPRHHSDVPLEIVTTADVENEENRELSHRVSELVTRAVHSRRQQFQDPVWRNAWLRPPLDDPTDQRQKNFT